MYLEMAPDAADTTTARAELAEYQHRSGAAERAKAVPEKP